MFGIQCMENRMSQLRVGSAKEWSELPEFEFPVLKGEHESGVVLDVLKVGFILVPETDYDAIGLHLKQKYQGKCVLPTAVIRNDVDVQLVKLPVDLSSWVFDTVRCAQFGLQCLPGKIEFGELDGRKYAEIE